VKTRRKVVKAATISVTVLLAVSLVCFVEASAEEKYPRKQLTVDRGRV
jgi:hypothetical protein